jgi:hypothetical protein
VHRDPDAPATLRDTDRLQDGLDRTRLDIDRLQQGLDRLAAFVKLMFEEQDRRWEERLRQLHAGIREELASAVNAATDRYLDYIRIANDVHRQARRTRR